MVESDFVFSNSCRRMISSRYWAACMKSRSFAACFINAVVLAMLLSNSAFDMCLIIGSAAKAPLSGSKYTLLYLLPDTDGLPAFSRDVSASDEAMPFSICFGVM